MDKSEIFLSFIKDSNRSGFSIYKCSCGSEKEIRRYDVSVGKISSCGCLKKITARNNTYKDMNNLSFGRLKVISEGTSKNSRQYWNCICECGKEITVAGKNLRSGNTKSCGICIKSQNVKALWDTAWYNRRCKNNSRNSVEYNRWIKTIKNHFNNKCFICKSKEKLHVHHLESYKKNIDLRTHLNNGIVLCQTHHVDFHKYSKKNITRGNFRNYLNYLEQGDSYMPSIGFDFENVIARIDLESFSLIEGSVEVVNSFIKRGYKVYIFLDENYFLNSLVSKVKAWLDLNGFSKEVSITTLNKPVNWWISNKAYRFTGNFDEVIAFISDKDNLISWNKK